MNNPALKKINNTPNITKAALNSEKLSELFCITRLTNSVTDAKKPADN